MCVRHKKASQARLSVGGGGAVRRLLAACRVGGCWGWSGGCAVGVPRAGLKGTRVGVGVALGMGKV